ncbi:Cytochrome P450 86B1 [Linum grandiflorum]
MSSLLQLLLSLSMLSLLLYICSNKKVKSRAVPNWPFLGVLPSLLWNLSQNQVHEFLTRILKLNGGTFFARGPCLNLVVTCDPMNVHHILSKNFSNYPKNMLEPLGEVLINSDGETWKMRREIVDSLLKSAKFHSLLIRTLHQKLGNNLIPILDRAAAGTKPLDLQDLMKRLTFDAICIVTLGFDPQSLSTESPHFSFEESFDLIMEVIMYRHCVPRPVWKMQGWFGIGKAGKFGAAVECVDRFLDDKIRVKMERCRSSSVDVEDGDFFGEVLSETERVFGRVEDCKFVREIVFTLMLAGRDTVAAGLTWFFWVVATNPDVEGKILEDMDQVTTQSGKQQRSFPSMEELNKLVYLQGAISETMRLYPPGPFNLKQSLESDVLPSGHAINKNTRIMISIYSMGRMEKIWGDDCLEFKPERWVLQKDEDGEKKNKIVHVPSYKLAAFLAGPRICPGRQIAFGEMKIVAYSVLSRFKIEVVEGFGGKDVVPLASIVMFMKYGLKVRVSKRATSYG